MRHRSYIPAILAVLIVLACGLTAYAATAPNPDKAPAPQTPEEIAAADLQRQIDDHNSQIKALNDEIAQYQKQLDKVSSAKQTLQGTLTQLNLAVKKTQASIKVTQNQISATQLQIRQLEKGIAGKQASIQDQESGLSESMRRLHEADQVSTVEMLMSSGGSVSKVWEDIDSLMKLQGSVKEQIDQLNAEKQSLTQTKNTTEQKKAQLVKQKNTLLAQQGTLDAQKQAQTDLLAQTKSQEATFQSIIAQKKAQEANFEEALNDLKTQLDVIINPSQITPAGKGVLKYPLDNVRITQYFGNTPFAASGAYNGKGHNGMDFAASIGTPLKAALSGVVLGTGNTDSVRGCYSFGKWVLIKHNNGLDTIYGHLSKISVTAGESVSTGEIIGYSGETGYATGPHLHFGVYVSSATQIIKLGDATKSKTPCANAVMPVAPIQAYLNPLNYLP